jgi:hypothetical protein
MTGALSKTRTTIKTVVRNTGIKPIDIPHTKMNISESDDPPIARRHSQDERGANIVSLSVPVAHTHTPATGQRWNVLVFMTTVMPNRCRTVLIIASALFGVLLAGSAQAHPMDSRNAGFVEDVTGAAPGPFLYLGAKHMVTGYDHILFLVGVIFFLYRMKDVVLYVSLFTLGHSITLLLGVLGGLQVNPYIIDAIIGLSVVYKGFENIGGFKRVFRVQPNTRWAVLVFGLFHGLGLATKLQEFTVVQEGLVTNILSFNVGVEIGQILALTAVLIALTFWRTRSSFVQHSFAANTALMIGGFALAGFQIISGVLFP